MTRSTLTADGIRAAREEWLIWRLGAGPWWAKRRRGDTALSRESLYDLDEALAKEDGRGVA